MKHTNRVFHTVRAALITFLKNNETMSKKAKQKTGIIKKIT